MTVHFYDAGQALSVLVMLPDGRRVLVDTGESASREGCGGSCEGWHENVMKGLRGDVPDRRLDLVWTTHQHSDHLGGAPAVLGAFAAAFYVDNGLDLAKVSVKRARDAAERTGAKIRVVDPDHREAPLADTELVRFRAVVPSAWPAKCHADPNACSIGLRIDYCQSSVLFTGDAPREEERVLDAFGPVTLLQVAHHGAETSSSAEFLRQTAPKYAVISSAHADEGTNAGYCHPRAGPVEQLTTALGGPGRRVVRAFDGRVKCAKALPDHWVDVPASDRLWVTARDRDVALVTKGDGAFEPR